MLETQNVLNENTTAQNTLKSQTGALAIPALLWFAGVPFGVVLLLWLLFFRG